MVTVFVVLVAFFIQQNFFGGVSAEMRFLVVSRGSDGDVSGNSSESMAKAITILMGDDYFRKKFFSEHHLPVDDYKFSIRSLKNTSVVVIRAEGRDREKVIRLLNDFYVFFEKEFRESYSSFGGVDIYRLIHPKVIGLLDRLLEVLRIGGVFGLLFGFLLAGFFDLRLVIFSGRGVSGEADLIRKKIEKELRRRGGSSVDLVRDYVDDYDFSLVKGSDEKDLKDDLQLDDSALVAKKKSRKKDKSDLDRKGKDLFKRKKKIARVEFGGPHSILRKADNLDDSDSKLINGSVLFGGGEIKGKKYDWKKKDEKIEPKRGEKEDDNEEMKEIKERLNKLLRGESLD